MAERSTEAEARRNIQRYLRQLSYFEPSILPPPIDGVEGDDTKKAVKAFQKIAGLPETGEVDEMTFERLFDAYIVSLDERALPLCISPFPSEPFGYSVESGSSAPIVRLVQLMLSEISAIYDLTPVSETGIYDDDTAQAVRELQYRNLLPVTGILDKATWNALARAYGLYLLYTDP